MVMACSERTGLVLPTLTNTLLQTKPTMLRGGSDAYQTLPDPVLAVRNPLVRLDWSTNCYHSADLALALPQGCFTNLYHRELGQGIKPDQPSRVGEYRRGGGHRGNVVEGIHSIEWWYTIKSGTHHGGRYREDFSEKIFLGRHAF